MTETAAHPPLVDGDGGRAEISDVPTAQAGSPLFAELVWAHHRYERHLHGRRANDGELEALQHEFRARLTEFQQAVGELEHVYWSTKAASAVGMTIRYEDDRRRRLLGWLRLPRLGERDDRVQLHRLSDWVTADAPRVADLLHECDLLAIRVGEVLRGTSERIAMRWLLGVQAHLLGFIERTRRLPEKGAEARLVAEQRKQLVEIERYYHRAASKAGRLVYVTGMLVGLLPVALLAVAVSLLLWAAGLWAVGI